jgi:hypothetical protein
LKLQPLLTESGSKMPGRDSQKKLCYTPGAFLLVRPGGKMSKEKSEQPQTNERHGSYAFETFQKFIDSHLVRGHDVRLFLDPQGNSYSILCVTCDPRLTDIVSTRH